MKLTIRIRGRRALRDKQAEALIRQAARAAFASFAYSFDAGLDVTLLDDQSIREYNREYRQVDRATDVLSFPMVDFYRGAYEGDIADEADPDTGAVPLGDMLISVERAREQAASYGHSFERECAYLTVHSVLHLLGFDHEDEGEEKAAMREKEEEILTVLGLAHN